MVSNINFSAWTWEKSNFLENVLLYKIFKDFIVFGNNNYRTVKNSLMHIFKPYICYWNLLGFTVKKCFENDKIDPFAQSKKSYLVLAKFIVGFVALQLSNLFQYNLFFYALFLKAEICLYLLTFKSYIPTYFAQNYVRLKRID